VASTDAHHGSHPRLPVGLGAIASCLAAAVLFGAAAPATKGLAQALDPQLLAALLYLGAAAAVLPWAWRDRRSVGRLPGRQGLRLAGAIVVGGVVAPVLLLAGLARAPAASVSLWLNFETVWTTVLAWLFFKEHVDRYAGAAVLLVLAAGAMLAWPERISGGWASALVIAACLGWGLDNNLTATIDRLTPAQVTCAKGLAAGGLNLIVAAVRGAPMPQGPQLLGALGIGAVAYGASLVLYISGSQQLGASRAQLLFATAPFAGSVLSWLVLREPVLPMQLLAGVVMVGAWVLLIPAAHGHPHTHEPTEHTHSHRHDDAHHQHEHPGLDPAVRHSHAHEHGPATHSHPHVPDLHHRHGHR